jgi:hypothetical protein
MLQKILRSIAAQSTPTQRIHQLIGRRQTEYHNPKFLSFHCGSAQFFATVSADSVAFAGAAGVSPEQAHNSAANRTTNPNRIDSSFCMRPDQDERAAFFRSKAAVGARSRRRNFGDRKAIE